MSSDDPTLSSAKKANSFAATSEKRKMPAKSTTRAGQVTNVYKSMAAIAAANGTKPASLSANQKKLLDRQAALIKFIQEQGGSGSNVSAEAKADAAANPASKLSIQEVATRVGIWTPTGKLSSSYKK